MADVNLIPAEFSRYLHLRRLTRKFALFFLCLLLVIGSGKMLLTRLITLESQKTSRLKSDEVSLLEQRTVLDSLRTRKADLKKRLTDLESVRGGPSVVTMFEVIDRTINNAIWFENWSLRRPGETPAAQRPATRQAGYFMVVPQNPEQPLTENSGFSLMTIRGKALSFARLAEFMHALLTRPEVKDLKVIKTLMGQNDGLPLLSFELEVMIRMEPGS